MKSSWLLVAVLVAGCGDNSDECGSGTTVVHGVCIPSATCGSGTMADSNGVCVPDGTVVCGAGTIFDPTAGTCVIDPTACQNGTVLIDGMCVDPNRGLVVDVEEGPEPNGLGLLEPSQNPAGIITTLNPIGGPGLVIHGHIDPFQDANNDGFLDPDVDAYLVDVTAPTLVHITAAGGVGVTAGFYVAPHVASGPLQHWQRVGMNLGGDTSKRQLYLPAAGEYVLAIADSRTLYQLVTAQTISGAPGGPDGDYYITIDQLDTPDPTLLAVTNQTATDTSTIGPEETKFYTVPMLTGLNAVTVDVPSSAVLGSVAVLKNGAYQETATETQDPVFGDTPASELVGGYRGVDLSLIVVEPAYDLAPGPVAYTLTVATRDAARSFVGAAAVTELSNTPSDAPVDLANYNQFLVGTATVDATVGLSITWTHPVRGNLLDENGDLAAEFVDTGDTADTWTTYNGLLRLKTAGMYYFVVYDPAGAPGTTTLDADTTFESLTTGTVASGTPTGQLAFSAFFENTFLYTPSAAWETYDSTGVNSGGQNVELLDAALAYGRLDAFSLDGGTIVDPPQNQFLNDNDPEGGGAHGRILLDDHVTAYLAKVTALAPTASPTFSLAFGPRTFTDLGTLGATAVTSANHALDGTNQPTYFLYRSAPTTPSTITVHPQVPASLDTQFQLVARDESALGPVVDTTNTGDDVTSGVLSTTGWSAFVVTATTPPSDPELFDVTVTH